jgi:acyl-[acyl-carrier-protein]-phospholipid O-acyltransferase/long-chain-fatty-acid--[acyl-carrier-protein] ligase
MFDRGSRSLFRHSGYTALLAAQILGAFNDNLFKMVVSLLAVSMAIGLGGGSGAYLSLTSAVFILPYLLFSGYAGHIADRFDKRSVLVFFKMLEIAIMALALAGLMSGSIGWMIVILFLMATQSAFFSPAKYGILPEILPATQLSRANGLLEFSRYIAVILGSVGGGLLLSLAGGRPVVVGMTLILIACVGALVSLRIGAVPRSGALKTFRINPWAEIITGVRRLVADRQLGPAVAGITFFEFLGALVMLDLLLLGKDVMALDDLSVSMLVAFAGLGIGIGSFAAGRLSGDCIALGLVPIGSAGVTAALVFLSYMPHSYGWTVVGVISVGAFGGLFLVPLNTLLQHASGPREKGHLIGTNNFLNMLGVLVSSGSLWLLRDVFSITPDRILLVAALLSGAVTLHCLICLPKKVFTPIGLKKNPMIE